MASVLAAGQAVSTRGRMTATQKLTYPPLDLVAFDLFGPSRVASRGGNTYMMIIVDSVTGHKHTAYLPDKSDDSTIPAFEEYRLMAERQTGKKLKRVRTDKAFLSARWKEYFKSRGILHEPTAPYSSPENGLAERAIRTITEDIRTLLDESGLPQTYWAAAGACATYARNRMPSRRHPGTIPQTAFDGRPVDVSHMRVFGSKCSAKVPIVNGHRVDGGGKLESRTIPATFIGYGTGAGNYLLIDENGHQFESRNVEFDEGTPNRTLDEGGESIAPEAPGDKSNQSFESASDVDGDVPDSRPNSPPPALTPEPVHAPPVEPAPAPPRRSTRHAAPSTRGIESVESTAREDAARAKRDDWATQSTKPRVPRANAAWDPIVSLNAQLDDHITQTLMSYNPDRLYVPKTYSDAIKRDPIRWTAAMDVEMALHEKKETWELQQPPPGANIMASKWVYDVKKDGAGQWLRDKARLVGKGFTQVHGIDYEETWAAVARLESIRMTAAIAAVNNLHLWQIDFEAAYLNSETKEEIYMEQPRGYEGGHDWAETLDGTYSDLDYSKSRADPCVRVKISDDGGYTITDTYTDDVWGASASSEEAEARKAELGNVWDIKDVGHTHRLLGMRVDQDLAAGTVTLSQRAYFEKVLADHGLENIKPRSTPLPVGIALDSSMCPSTPEEHAEMVGKPYRTLVGAVMWGQLATRPDLSFPVSILTRFQTNPGIEHWRALLHVLGYIRHTLDYALVYSRNGSLTPKGYGDADYAGCVDTRRSTSGYVFVMAGAPVSWSSKRQATVALSTVEAEYISLTRAAQQQKWMYSWMEEVGLKQELPGTLYCDNRGAVDLTKNTKAHSKVKHIDIRHHFIRELVQMGELNVNFIRGNENPADLFTKPLPRDAHHRYLAQLNIVRVE
ncbi:Gag-Pol polyprotein [Mycena sanguinolenta]|uniref:Gag-Pol polyprotein n=1 Tax=Mycena sanguinolenta TaxID=230812 RepID=A0A8H6Y6A1_9AGAR|nr:Gag-Pol polyprotein [Mycena sanguinolenta]